MKKKSLLAIGLSLSMVMATSIPALAANTNTNVNADGTLVNAPGHPDYAAGNTQVAGESYNEANITSVNGTDWATVNDDDALAGAADVGGADINVWAKVTDSGSKVYKVDLAWGAMKFEYNSGSGQWNPATHTYDANNGTAGWTEAAYLDGKNNKVTVTNHSNNGIDAAFAYAMNGTKFNDKNGVNNVIGNFFADNTTSATAAKVLTGTYSDANGAVNDAAVADKLAGSKVALPTADAYNNSANPPTSTAGDQIPGARTKDVFFAFSGTPDKGKGKDLDTFKKVGVITVTVAPNNDAPLNQPVWTAPAP